MPLLGLLRIVNIGTFPGQAGNPVGYTATPVVAPAAFSSVNGQTWPGAFSSLTAWPGGTGAQTISGGTHATSGAGTSGNPWVFAFRDFDALAAGTVLSLSNAIFVGCRFQSNSVNNQNISVTGSNVSLIYCSIVPRVTLWSSPPNGTWPSAGAGLGLIPSSVAYTDTGNYCVPASDGYQYGLKLDAISGPFNADHCDIWGFGNAVTFLATSFQVNITNNWIHDGANCNTVPPGGSTNYHTDGPGYLNGGTPPQNILIQGNTIASIGNTNGIAFQAAISEYNNIRVLGNYMSGFNDLADICHLVVGSTNIIVTDNVFGTDLPWVSQPVYSDPTTLFTRAVNPTNLWRRNKLNIRSGTTPNAGSNPSWNSSQNGFFLFPNSTLSATDYAG